MRLKNAFCTSADIIKRNVIDKPVSEENRYEVKYRFYETF